MMEEEKQIEEIEVENFIKLWNTLDCLQTDSRYTYKYIIARAFIAAGYRKQSDTVREFIQELFAMSREQANGGIYTIKPWTENVKELAKKYGVNTEDICD